MGVKVIIISCRIGKGRRINLEAYTEELELLVGSSALVVVLVSILPIYGVLSGANSECTNRFRQSYNGAQPQITSISNSTHHPIHLPELAVQINHSTRPSSEHL